MIIEIAGSLINTRLICMIGKVIDNHLDTNDEKKVEEFLHKMITGVPKLVTRYSFEIYITGLPISLSLKSDDKDYLYNERNKILDLWKVNH